MCLARTTKLTEELANIEIIYMIDMKTNDLWQTAYLNGLQKYNWILSAKNEHVKNENPRCSYIFLHIKQHGLRKDLEIICKKDKYALL